MKKNANKIYGCETALIKFPLSTQMWLNKQGFSTPIHVPVRRNCMTGSGIAQQCHSNVLQLVEIYGGHRLGGYVVNIDHDEDGKEFTIFISHSVWVTPEGKAVDVTAHNFTDEKTVLFIPKYKETGFENVLLDFVLPKHFVKDGVLVNIGDENNFQLAVENGLEFVQFEENMSFVRLPSSRFTYKAIHQIFAKKDGFSWKDAAPDGGFTQDSRWSKKSWKEIKAEYLLAS